MEKHTTYKITDEAAKKFLDGLSKRKADNLDGLRGRFAYFFGHPFPGDRT